MGQAAVKRATTKGTRKPLPPISFHDLVMELFRAPTETRKKGAERKSNARRKDASLAGRNK